MSGLNTRGFNRCGRLWWNRGRVIFEILSRGLNLEKSETNLRSALRKTACRGGGGTPANMPKQKEVWTFHLRVSFLLTGCCRRRFFSLAEVTEVASLIHLSQIWFQRDLQGEQSALYRALLPSQQHSGLEGVAARAFLLGKARANLIPHGGVSLVCKKGFCLNMDILSKYEHIQHVDHILKIENVNETLWDMIL